MKKLMLVLFFFCSLVVFARNGINHLGEGLEAYIDGDGSKGDHFIVVFTNANGKKYLEYYTILEAFKIL
jgi:hypothetical protein